MRWIYFIVLQVMLVLAIAGLVYKHQDKAIIVKTPPKELAQWYKPENKRQVWLHNMFKLRREMQAVAYYAEKKENKHLSKWAVALTEHYLKIGEMVPSWHKKLDTVTLASLQDHAIKQNYSGVLASVNTLQKNCDSCHQDYQAVTALTYRAPDFSTIEIEPSLSFNSHMQTLTEQVNQIKIAAEDNEPVLAISTLANLKENLHKLGQVCSDCHKKDKKPYPSTQMNKTILSLEHNLKTGTLNEQGRDLGTLAVLACARCHGTHRLVYGAKALLSKQPSLTELIKH
ncbi:hypothetical protein NBRC116592_22800 [Colwellia sp. KU-HH00111]|uniref:hypothetical protein n=1 Tax=Colwellia sp. KU-HH00111 TaxID=3127652 RepID=UPI003107B4BE